MLIQFQLAVQRRVGIDNNVQPLLFATVKDKHGHVFNSAIGEVVNTAMVAAEAKVIIKGLDIHAHPGNLLAAAQQTEIAPQLFVAILLMAQRAAHDLGRLPQQLDKTLLIAHRQANRHGIRHHRRNAAQTTIHPCRHRHTEDQILLTTHSIGIRRQHADQQLRHTSPRLLCDVTQLCGALQRQDQRAATQAAAARSTALRQGNGIGQAGQLRLPIVAIALNTR